MLKKFRSGGTISARFRTINIALFLVASVVVGAVVLGRVRSVVDAVAKDYARLYSGHTVGDLNAFLGREIALLRKAANSPDVIEWFRDENNPPKKLAAFQEMMGVISVPPVRELYLGIGRSLHEYTLGKPLAPEDLDPYASLDPASPDDAWYFAHVASNREYVLDVRVDKVLLRKRVWLDYRVTHDNASHGVICTGLDFAPLVEKLFAEYDADSVRGLVIDEKGVIQMDSALLGNENFLRRAGQERRVGDEFSNAALLSAVAGHLGTIDGYFDGDTAIAVIEMPGEAYQYATIAPIDSTAWSVVTLYNSSSLFSMAELLPIVLAAFLMLAVFISATGYMSSRLIFAPFEKMVGSIRLMSSNRNTRIYGTDRKDEIGDLANTVMRMRDSLVDALGKVHYDALTGTYNRRFLEENLPRVVRMMSRAGGDLAVMMIDVDFFKKFNDAYGHGEGDACLRQIALALSEGLHREGDFVARYGGEEFTVVLPGTDESGARVMADRLLQGVRARGIPHRENAAADCATISIGVASGSVRHTQSGEEYIKRADEALYLSKKSGRNKYTILDMGKERIQPPPGASSG